jgi:hypothetical protein
MVSVIDDMRRDLRITPETSPETSPAGRTHRYAIEFAYPNALKARAVVLALAARLGKVRVDEPAGVYETGVRPGRAAVAGIGLGIGLLAGLITWAVRRAGLGLLKGR